MNSIVIALVCLAIAAVVTAAPPASASSQDAQVLRFDSDVQPESYKFA